jgi:predicted NAD/FAD-dependent oxidoreductase
MRGVALQPALAARPSAARPLRRSRAAATTTAAAPGGRPAAEQVTFEKSLPRSGVSVGIIGGGLAGAVTAAALSAHGIDSVVYDTGVHGPGGRLATRELGRDGRLRFDHAAQYFTATDARFEHMVARWRDAGVVADWHAPVGVLRPGGAFAPLPATPQRLVAPAGMRSIAEHVLAREAPRATLRRPCWVGEMKPALADGVWRLVQAGRVVGEHHFVVIAHNGKCATKLLRPSGAPAVDAQMARMKLSSVWCLMAAFAEPLRAPCEGAFVTGAPALAWAANNSAKLGLSGEGGECWTLLSTAAYGRANKCPQEAVPPEVSARVTAEMLAALAAALGRAQLPATTLTRTQLWGAALPTNTPRVPCIFDGAARVGMCGDWLLGADMQCAALSGQATADAIAAACAASAAGAGSLAHLSAGLTARFSPVGGSESLGTREKGLPAQAPAQGQREQQRRVVAAPTGAGGRSYSSRGGRAERRGVSAELQATVRNMA